MWNSNSMKMYENRCKQIMWRMNPMHFWTRSTAKKWAEDKLWRGFKKQRWDQSFRRQCFERNSCSWYQAVAELHSRERVHSRFRQRRSVINVPAHRPQFVVNCTVNFYACDTNTYCDLVGMTIFSEKRSDAKSSHYLKRTVGSTSRRENRAGKAV